MFPRQTSKAPGRARLAVTCSFVALAHACGSDPSGLDDASTSGVGADVGSGDAATTDDGGIAGDTTGNCIFPCGNACCAEDEQCIEETCTPGPTTCNDADDCDQDATCEAGECTPWPDGGFDPACGLQPEPGIFRVSLQCEWTAPPPGDPAPSSTSVPTTPLVADFDLPGAVGHISPSIVFSTQGGGNVIRVIDGTTCAHQYTLEEVPVMADSTSAIGDLDGDGRPEIVAHRQAGGLVAWTYDPGLDDFVVLWQSADTTATGVHSLSLGDLDDDGVPEIVAGALVYGADGVLRSSAAGQGDSSCGAYRNPAALADVDLDDRLELVQGGSIWTWDDVANELVPEPYVEVAGSMGFIAVADFGDFPGVAGDAPGRPEVVVVSPGTVRIQTIAGALVFGPAPLPGGGDGGNVTIADFDGDDVPELSVVGLTRFVVYDPACGDAAWPGVCATGTTDGMLWQQVIDENSCAIMGSTVFDFEADGAAEVVYGDECYVRVMRGTDGEVVWSHPRSSATWYEAPIVADADGDLVAEMVVPVDPYAGGACPGIDPVFAGLRCSATAACPGDALVCDADLCRCTTDADCGDPQMVCTEPLPGSPGAGNVCRSTWSAGTGVRVYADDAWAGSRPVWNQHAYSVTHVDDAGAVPAGPAMVRNWEDPGLNNFRQNVQSGLAPVPGPDLTVEGLEPAPGCTASDPVLVLRAEVCNRGPLAVDPGIAVSFHDGPPPNEVCATTTSGVLTAGACETVSCEWIEPPLNVTLSIHVVVDGEEAVLECHEGNNEGWLETQCPPPPAG